MRQSVNQWAQKWRQKISDRRSFVYQRHFTLADVMACDGHDHGDEIGSYSHQA